MKDISISKRLFYGIRKKLLIYSFGVFIVIITLTVGLISNIVEKNIDKLTIEKYQYLCEKILSEFENNYKTSDELFKKYIDYSPIQMTLEHSVTPDKNRKEVKQMLAYVDFDDMNRAVYIDNKGNVYGARLICFNYKQFVESDLYKVLEGSYSTTKWSWQKDTLFGTKDESLFIMRYIRHMQYPVPPGVMVLKMNDNYFANIIKGMDDGVNYMFWDEDYHLCYRQDVVNEEVSEETYNEILKQVKNKESKQIIELKEGILFVNQEKGSKISVAILVPRSKIESVFNEIKDIIIGVWLIFCLFSICLINIFSKKYTEAVQAINTSMKNFDGSEYSSDLVVHTDTELDEIAVSYHQMLERIQQLMLEVELREKALRKSELNSLMHQINPHFLYNTLDNIYMLARINHDEQTKKMIEELSNFLRIGLSNGKQEITIEEELQHIKSYMEIMKMRGSTEFSYHITCEESLREQEIIKLILQPIVENSIKHGFNNVRVGVIEIDITQQAGNIIFSIKDNGGSMPQEVVDKYNKLMYEVYDSEAVAIETKKGGYGIRNVVNRLKLKYGNEFSFKYESNEKVGTICWISLPNGRSNT